MSNGEKNFLWACFLVASIVAIVNSFWNGLITWFALAGVQANWRWWREELARQEALKLAREAAKLSQANSPAAPTPTPTPVTAPVLPRRAASGPVSRSAAVSDTATAVDISPVKLRFSYLDAEGEPSRRTVTVRVVTPFYMKGRCHERKADRTFRWDRVIGNVANMDTGELMSAEDAYVTLVVR